MAYDPRAAEAAQKYLWIMNELQTLGPKGFAYLLDTASAEEMSMLLAGADTLIAHVQRVKAALGR